MWRRVRVRVSSSALLPFLSHTYTQLCGRTQVCILVVLRKGKQQIQASQHEHQNNDRSVESDVS